MAGHPLHTKVPMHANTATHGPLARAKGSNKPQPMRFGNTDDGRSMARDSGDRTAGRDALDPAPRSREVQQEMKRLDPKGDAATDMELQELEQKARDNVYKGQSTPRSAGKGGSTSLDGDEAAAKPGKATKSSRMSMVDAAETEGTGDSEYYKDVMNRAKMGDPKAVSDLKDMIDDPEAQWSAKERKYAQQIIAKPDNKPKATSKGKGSSKGGFNPGYNFWLHRGPKYGTNPTSKGR
jgi:hypothetical protein